MLFGLSECVSKSLDAESLECHLYHETSNLRSSSERFYTQLSELIHPTQSETLQTSHKHIPESDQLQSHTSTLEDRELLTFMNDKSCLDVCHRLKMKATLYPYDFNRTKWDNNHSSDVEDASHLLHTFCVEWQRFLSPLAQRFLQFNHHSIQVVSSNVSFQALTTAVLDDDLIAKLNAARSNVTGASTLTKISCKLPTPLQLPSGPPVPIDNLTSNHWLQTASTQTYHTERFTSSGYNATRSIANIPSSKSVSCSVNAIHRTSKIDYSYLAMEIDNAANSKAAAMRPTSNNSCRLLYHSHLNHSTKVACM